MGILDALIPRAAFKAGVALARKKETLPRIGKAIKTSLAQATVTPVEVGVSATFGPEGLRRLKQFKETLDLDIRRGVETGQFLLTPATRLFTIAGLATTSPLFKRLTRQPDFQNITKQSYKAIIAASPLPSNLKNPLFEGIENLTPETITTISQIGGQAAIIAGAKFLTPAILKSVAKLPASQRVVKAFTDPEVLARRILDGESGIEVLKFAPSGKRQQVTEILRRISRPTVGRPAPALLELKPAAGFARIPDIPQKIIDKFKLSTQQVAKIRIGDFAGLAPTVVDAIIKSASPQGIEPSVIQITNEKNPELNRFFVVPKGQADKFSFVDSDIKAVEDKFKQTGEVFHLSATTPQKISQAGFKFAGVAQNVADIGLQPTKAPITPTEDPKALPAKPEVAKVPIAEPLAKLRPVSEAISEVKQKLLTFGIIGRDFVTFTATPEFKRAFRERPEVRQAIEDIRIEKDTQKAIAKTEKLLAKELPLTRIKPIIEKAVGIRKTVDIVVTNEAQLLRQRLAAETRGAKAGLKLGKREIRTEQQVKTETVNLVKSINSLAGRDIPLDFKDEVNAIMAKYDLHFRRPKTIKERVSRKAFVERLREEGELIPIPDNLLDKLDTITLNDLNVENLRSIKDTIGMIVHIGQNKGKLIAAKEIRDFTKVESEVTKRVLETGRVAPEIEEPKFQPPSIRKKTAVQKITESLDGYFSSHRFTEQIARTLDKFKVGPVQDNIIKPIQDAGDAELVKSVEANTKVIEVLQPIAKDLNNKIRILSFPVEITQEEALMLYLNSQNAGNLERLVLGNNLTEAQIGDLVNFLNKNHPAIITAGNNIFDIVEGFYNETAKVTLKATGQRLGKVKGRYFSIITDRELSLQQQFREAKQDLFKQVFNRASVEKGFTKTRVGGTDPVALSMDSIFRQIHAVIHYNTHALAVRDVQKLIFSPKIKASISQVMSPGVYQQFKSWIADVADPRTPNVNALEKAARRLKNNTTKAILGFKFTVSLLQGGSFTQTINEIGLPSALSGLYEFWRNPQKSTEFMRENSVQMKFRSRNLDRDMKAFLDSKEGKALMKGKPGGRELFFAMIQGVDFLTVAPSWLGTYGKELKATNGDIDASRREADRIIRITQPQGAIKDLASIARGRPFQKLWTAFYSHFSRYHNLVVSEMDKLKFGDDHPMRKVYNVARSFWFLLMIPVFLGTMIRSGFKFKDLKDFGKKYAKEAISYSFGGLIGIRDFARIFASQIVGQKFFGTKISPPGLRGFELLAKASGEKELKDKVITGARGLGVLTGRFPEQAFITGEGLMDLVTGKATDLRRLVLSKFALGKEEPSIRFIRDNMLRAIREGDKKEAIKIRNNFSKKHLRLIKEIRKEGKKDEADERLKEFRQNLQILNSTFQQQVSPQLDVRQRREVRPTVQRDVLERLRPARQRDILQKLRPRR